MQVDKERFDLFVSQYLKKIEGEEMVFVKSEWPERMLITPILLPHNFYNHFYEKITPKFLKWVRSLPNFDSFLLYEMTLIKEFL